MSAYIVSKNHILYLAQAGSHVARGRSRFGWFWGGDWHYATSPQEMADAANMLYLENLKSVSARYPGESSATLPGPNDRQSFVIEPNEFLRVPWDAFNPVQILKSCDCYTYQTCEHQDWEKSEAFALIQALRSAAWHALPGYEESEWGCPKTLAEKRAEYMDRKRTAGLGA